MNRKDQEDSAWESIGCYSLLWACTLGPLIMLAVGAVTYEWITQFEFGSGEGLYTTGQALGSVFSGLGLLFMYLVVGTGLGVFTIVRFIRFGRWCSQDTAVPVLMLTLLNGLMNFVGSSFLVTISFSNDIPYTPMRRISMALVAISLLVFNLFLPRWIREITGRR